MSRKTEDQVLGNVWSGMKNRCYRPEAINYSRYGGRGILVTEEWRNDFQAFKDWALENGYKPGLHLDRIDNNGPYSPFNCRWVEPKVNMRNTRINHSVTAFGETKTLIEWSEDSRCVVDYHRMKTRIIRDKWDAERAITTPGRRYVKK